MEESTYQKIIAGLLILMVVSNLVLAYEKGISEKHDTVTIAAFSDMVRSCNNDYQSALTNITLANKWIWFNNECQKINSSVQFVEYGYICVHNNQTEDGDSNVSRNTSA